MIDLFPTFLAAAGGSPDPAWKIDGMNLLPCWMGQAKPPERTLFWEWRAEGYHQIAAISNEFKLVITGNTPPDLYNVVADPAERRTIIGEYPKIGAALRDEAKEWLATEAEAAKDKGEKKQ